MLTCKVTKHELQFLVNIASLHKTLQFFKINISTVRYNERFNKMMLIFFQHTLLGAAAVSAASLTFISITNACYTK